MACQWPSRYKYCVYLDIRLINILKQTQTVCIFTFMKTLLFDTTTKPFSADYYWCRMRVFPCDYLTNPGQQTCILGCLAIEVTAMVQPTKIGITRKLYRPNLLFASTVRITTVKQGVAFFQITIALNEIRGKFCSGI